jgi:hypothetical protein
MDGNLDTTNLMLGIIAAVSVLEALVLVGIGVGAFRARQRPRATARRASDGPRERHLG